MQLNNLHPYDWAQLTIRYPDAAAFLVARNNKNEYDSLREELRTNRSSAQRLAWVALRIADMEACVPSLKPAP